MTFLRELLSLPREGLIISAADIVALLATVWLFTLLSRQRYATIKRSIGQGCGCRRAASKQDGTQ